MIDIRILRENPELVKENAARRGCDVNIDELRALDQQYLEFGTFFENRFINQGYNEDRSIEQTLDLGWEALSKLPSEELQRVTDEEISQYYRG